MDSIESKFTLVDPLLDHFVSIIFLLPRKLTRKNRIYAIENYRVSPKIR
jgi:hypothetical protein